MNIDAIEDKSESFRKHSS